MLSIMGKGLVRRHGGVVEAMGVRRQATHPWVAHFRGALKAARRLGRRKQ
jgi:hypothetical protein